MNKVWNELVGVCLAHRYVLEECLSQSEIDAWYQTRAEGGVPAVVRVMREDAERLSAWRSAVEVRHANLVRVYDAGRTQASEVSLIYLVCAMPEEFLAEVLAGRALTEEETLETLRAMLGGLRFLHGRGLAHGAVDPEHVMAFDDGIKLQSDTWEKPRTSGQRRRPGVYDAPEAARGAVSPASDMWSLGVTLHQLLTQRPANLEQDSEFAGFAEPFATVLRKTLVRDPESRWSAVEVLRYLTPGDGPAVAAEKRAPAAVEENAAPPLRQLLQQAPRYWVVLAAGLLVALALSFYLLRQPSMTAASPRPAAPAAVTAGRPSAFSPAGGAQAAGVREEARWRVIAYTYNQRSMAQQKVTDVNARYPEFMAEVFTPGSESGPFLVALGGRMTRVEAQELLREAREKGLPRDAYVRNFVK